MTARSGAAVPKASWNEPTQEQRLAMTTRSAPDWLSEEARALLAEPPGVIEALDVGDPAFLAELRKALDEDGVTALAELELEHEFESVALAGVRCEWMRTPATTDDERVLIHFHGGGYVGGAPRGSASMALPIADAAGVPVLSVDYRLAPEHPYPAAVDDGVAVFREVLKSRPASRIGLFGESAGGGLTAATLLALRDAGHPLPAAAAIVSPMADLSGGSDTRESLRDFDPLLTWEKSLAAAAAAYVGNADPRDPSISPVYADLRGLPALLIHSGAREVLLGDALRLARAARRAGVDVTLDVWDGLWHVFQAVPSLPEAREACAEIGRFLRQRLD
jgi:acetyl esterase/lipase